MSGSTGAVIGRAAGSLGNSGAWAQSAAAAKAGVRGETSTAKILDALAGRPGGPTVLHDLRIPIPGIKANIDHLVVSGRTITIIDSKVWKPGFYWTFGGRTWRGRERFAPADKHTMEMAFDAIVKLLARERISAGVSKPLLVVWPSNSRLRLRLQLLHSPGAHAVSGQTFTARAASLVGAKSADPKIVATLRSLVIPARRAAPSSTVRDFAPGEI